MEKYFDKTSSVFSENINSFLDLKKNDQERIIYRVEDLKHKLGRDVFINNISKNDHGINVVFCCGELFCSKQCY